MVKELSSLPPDQGCWPSWDGDSLSAFWSYCLLYISAFLASFKHNGPENEMPNVQPLSLPLGMGHQTASSLHLSRALRFPKHFNILSLI